ncbi:MAG TPA: cytochrome-c peroxidase [Bacillus bacterium]|nr:cytochrome-c peroxidase [Bacillus sp. (in: firmicutes)]
MIKKFMAGVLIGLFLSGCSLTEEAEVKAPDSDAIEKNQEQAEVEQIDAVIQRILLRQDLFPVGSVPVPADNPMTPEVIKLGQTLFFDPRLSGDNTVSCQTCHDPNKGYGDGLPTMKKLDGTDGSRNSPTIINAGYYSTYFWDGRASSLEEQALGPIQNPDEMNQTLPELIAELKSIEGYNELFAAAFEDGITEENLAKALAAFQRLVVVKDTPYDQFLRGDRGALNDQEIRGLDLFVGKAFCVTCHNGPNLSDNKYYNIGLESGDEGRFAITGDPGDLGRIRTPSLYGITHTAPYLHDGSASTLEEIVDYYNRGGDNHENKSFFIKRFMNPLGLTDEEKVDLIAFLKALGGEPVIFTKPVLP